MKLYVVSDEALAESRDNGDDRVRGEALDLKCGGCNWECGEFLVLADSQEEADALFVAQEAGMCGDCMTEMLKEEGYEVNLGQQFRVVRG